MTPPLWVVELAEAFWDEAGEREGFPRRLVGPILRSSFELTIEELPRLSIADVERYLARRDWMLSCGEVDRPLRGCLAARDGACYLFVDARDEPAERTVSLAHELAHFLRDYWQPRRRAVAGLGQGVLDVLDGRRPARPEERLHALLRVAPIGPHVHLLRRDNGTLPPDVAAAERDADLLALELLAPREAVYAAVPPVATGGLEALNDRGREVLRRVFGLPEAVATSYAAELFPPVESDPLIDRLRKARSVCRALPSARE